MTEIDLGNWESQLRKGLLDCVILNLLRQGKCHGYEMVQTLKGINGLKIREGNIYPILARLAMDGLIVSHEERSLDGPPRKYYELTAAGQEAVAEMNRHWDRIIESIARIRNEGNEH